MCAHYRGVQQGEGDHPGHQAERQRQTAISSAVLADHHYVEIAALGLDRGDLKDGQTARNFATGRRAINIARFRERHPEMDARALPEALMVEDARRWYGGVIAPRIETLRYRLEDDDHAGQRRSSHFWIECMTSRSPTVAVR